MSTQNERILSGLLRGKKLTVRDMLFSPYNSNCPPRRIKDIEEKNGINVERDEVVKGKSRFRLYYLSKDTINKIKKERKNAR
jgi:hypothetical protein